MISNWLHFRNVKFIVEEYLAVNRTVYRGLPQGAVLSPLLYNIYTSHITSELPENVSHVMFADDIAIWSSSVRFDQRRQKIENAIQILYLELNKLGLDLQPDKTKLIDFGKMGYINRECAVKCVNRDLSVKKEAKFLGILFDNRLIFEAQCRSLKDRVIRINSMFKYISSVSWGLEVNTALLLYKGLVRSIIDYGSVIFVPNNDCNSRLYIERAQFAGLRSAMGYRNSTPTNVIVAKAKVTYIRNRAKFLAKNFCSKVLVYGDDNLKKELSEHVRAEVRSNLLVPWRKYTIFSETWLKSVRHRDILFSHNKYTVFNEFLDYYEFFIA